MTTFVESQPELSKKNQTNRTALYVPHLCSKPAINTGVARRKANKIRTFKLLLSPVRGSVPLLHEMKWTSLQIPSRLAQPRAADTDHFPSALQQSGRRQKVNPCHWAQEQ